MTDTPNQPQIEPSAEAMDVFMHYMSTYTTYSVVGTALKLAYAIDLAPIIAERDRMRAALSAVTKLYCDIANSGDAGFWNPEQVPEIMEARAALESKP